MDSLGISGISIHHPFAEITGDLDETMASRSLQTVCGCGGVEGARVAINVGACVGAEVGNGLAEAEHGCPGTLGTGGMHAEQPSYLVATAEHASAKDEGAEQ